VLRPYLRVLRVPGIRSLFVAALLGSLPLSMMTPGVLLLVQSRTGSLALAGLISGALTVGNAVGLLVQGRLIDVYGTRRVLVPAAVGCAAAFVTLTTVTVVPLAFLAGCLIPATITGVRLRLPEVLDDPADRDAAYAFLAVLGQLCLVTGPVLVAAMLILHRPVIPVLGVGVLGSLAALVFVRVAGRPLVRQPTAWSPSPGLVTVLLTGFGVGLAIGFVNVAIPAAHGTAWAGPLFTGLAIGDLIGGVLYGSRRWRAPLPARLIRALALAAVPAALAPVLVAPMLVVLGVLIAVPGVVLSTLLDTVASGGLARAYTALIAAILVGSSIGTALGGLAPSWAFSLSALALLAAASFARLRRSTLLA
jgi:MFS family permease